MAGTSGEVPDRVRRAPKPKLPQVTATADPASSAKPVVEVAARRTPIRQPKATLAASGNDTALLPPGTLTNAIVTETIPAAASVVRLNVGLYAVKVGASREEASAPAPAPSPIWVGPLAADGGFEALSAGGRGEQWLRETETSLAVRAPKNGVLMMATAFGFGDRVPSAPSVIVQSLDGTTSLTGADGAEPSAASPQIPLPAPPAEREIRAEITAHIERVGDRVFAGSTWAGTPGAQRRIEGFSIKPLQEIQPSEIEYKALHPGGIETPWVRGPQFCGTRGRSLPLTGLAIRVAPHVQDQFSVIYQAAFFRSGITEARSNGAPCLPKLPGDSLEGINIRIVQRRPG
jgi:hypothetical protein